MAENFDFLEFDDELRRYHEARPFTPFDIVTASGDRYEVQDPLQLAQGATVVVVVLRKSGAHIIRRNQITALHVHEPA